jgi:CelD/BcsL family acetyltransferase involved in cellulose biosynthesis
VTSLEALAAEWDELAVRTGTQPWATPGWIRAWQQAFSPASELVLYHARDAGRLSGVGAFLRNGDRLQSAANVHSPWWAVAAEDAEARDGVLAAALADRPRSLALGQVRENAGEEDALRRSAPVHGYRVVSSVGEHAPYVQASTDWHTYYTARISRHQRKEIERCRRRLGDDHALRYEWLTPDPETVDVLLDDGFRVEASGWKGRVGTAILSQPSTATFYREVARWAASRGWLRLGFLRADGRAAAFEFALEKDGVVSLVKGGYDEALSRFGPGILLLHDLLEDAFGRGVREIDLLGGDEQYKLRWADATRNRSLVTAFAGTPVGTAGFARHRLKLVAKHAARTARRRFRSVHRSRPGSFSSR